MVMEIYLLTRQLQKKTGLGNPLCKASNGGF
jgi:hypothetical protein